MVSVNTPSDGAQDRTQLVDALTVERFTTHKRKTLLVVDTPELWEQRQATLDDSLDD